MLGRIFSAPLPALPRAREPAAAPAPLGPPGDPRDLRVVHDGGVVRVDEDDLVVLVPAVLPDPVGIEDLEVRGVGRGAVLRDALSALRHGDLVAPPALRIPTAPELRPPQAAAAHAEPD